MLSDMYFEGLASASARCLPSSILRRVASPAHSSTHPCEHRKSRERGREGPGTTDTWGSTREWGNDLNSMFHAGTM